MNAGEVIEALRRRHPALAPTGPGPWTTLTEYQGIDFLAFAAWSRPTPKIKDVAYPIIGYEVKVSRSDYRREILRPGKRAGAVARCHAFYMATPKGLLSDEERAYVEPEHFADGSAFVREPCPDRCMRDRRLARGSTKTGHRYSTESIIAGPYCWITRHRDGAIDEGHEPNEWETRQPRMIWHMRECATCEGRGYLRQSVVEEQAPTLWIPADVGLVEASEAGRCRVIRPAPVNMSPDRRWSIGEIVRYASYHGDPRHRNGDRP